MKGKIKHFNVFIFYTQYKLFLKNIKNTKQFRWQKFSDSNTNLATSISQYCFKIKKKEGILFAFVYIYDKV